MDIEALLLPIDASAPAGRDCAHSREFQELTTFADYLSARAVLDDLERQSKAVFSGDNAQADQKMAQDFAQDARRNFDALAASIKEITGKAASLGDAENQVIARGESILGSVSKDLRVAQIVAFAHFSRSGLEGLSQGALLIDRLLVAFPGNLHPTPDEDDPEDTIARALVVSDMLGGKAFVSQLRKTVVMQSPLAGRWTGWESEAADPAVGTDPMLRAIILALKSEGPAKALQQQQWASSSLESLVKVTKHFASGSVRGDRLLKLLRRIDAHINNTQETPTQDAAPADPTGQPHTPANAGPSGPARLQTRDDARRVILEVCEFIEGMEPSHPAPLFLRRAERLLGAKDFFAIVRDMAPDSIAELERITGYKEPDPTS